MADNKNQHYVPQFYLKNFSSDKKNVGTYVIGSKKYIASAPIKNQCSENNFYPDENYEKALSGLEAEASLVFDKIIKSEAPLSKKDKFTALSFTVLQNTRTRHSTEQIKHALESMLNYVKSMPMTDEFRATLETAPSTDKEYTELLTSAFGDILKMSLDLTLKVLRNKTSVPFITSDDPVITCNKHLERLGQHSYGITCNGMTLIMPISSRYAIIIYDGGTYKVGHRRDLYVDILNDKDVMDINILAVLYAKQTIHFLSSTVPECTILEYLRKAESFHQSEDSTFECFMEDNGDSGLIHSSSENFHINAAFSYIKELDKAKAIKSLGNSFCVADITRPYCMALRSNETDQPHLGNHTFDKKIFDSRYPNKKYD